jgi:hypothetical protein
VAELAVIKAVRRARLALATILQAYAGVSDDEVIEATVMDRRLAQPHPARHEPVG